MMADITTILGSIFSGIWNFIWLHKWVFLVYLVIAIVIFINRKKFTVENKFILIYRSKYGINAINKLSTRHKSFIQLLGYIAIGVGFLGMLAIGFLLLQGLYNLIFVPSAPPTISPVIPGVKIPGSPFVFPIEYTLPALFIVVLIHELGHGIVAKANGLAIKSTGIVFFGPLPGAFVEPDEKALQKQPVPIQNAMFAAGPFANIVLTGIALLLLLILTPLMLLMITPTGVSFEGLQDGQPAQLAGVQTGVTYTQINGQPMDEGTDLTTALSCVRPNESVILSNDDSNVTIITAPHPEDDTKGYLGVTGITTEYELKNDSWVYSAAYNILRVLIELIKWVAMLSAGLGLANLMPILLPLDGTRMLGISLEDAYGKEKGLKILGHIALVTTIIVLVLLFVPILRALF